MWMMSAERRESACLMVVVVLLLLVAGGADAGFGRRVVVGPAVQGRGEAQEATGEYTLVIMTMLAQPSWSVIVTTVTS
jgi:hypothetical protein